MDSTLVGVMIGSGVSLFGSVLSQFMLSQKEQKQWKNKQDVENRAWERDEQKKEKEYLREIYQNSLRSLSVFIALENQSEELKNGQQKLELIDEIHKWVTMLLLRHSNSKLDNVLNSFTVDPDASEANYLRAEIIQLSNREESFFLNSLNNSPENSSPENNEAPSDPDLRVILMSIDNDFRKQQLIEGVEIPQRYEFEFKLSKMSKSQRGKLAEIYFQSHKTIPSKFSFFLPNHNKETKQIVMEGKQWQAKLNPNMTEPAEIFCSWEKDFDYSFEEAAQGLKARNDLQRVAQNETGQ
ncbi:MAG: hypothetical protein JZU65_17405 [Chlorobium sp.]|nr:hypothetical protein [Chlorobium sp.]